MAALVLLLITGSGAAELRLVDPESEVYYHFAVVAGDRVGVDGGAEISGNLHSNDRVDLKSGSMVDGDVSSAGDVKAKGTVTGEINEDVDPVALPAIPDESALRALADRVFETDTSFQDQVIDDVVFVDGKAMICGAVSGTGTLIATRDISVEKVDSDSDSDSDSGDSKSDSDGDSDSDAGCTQAAGVVLDDDTRLSLISLETIQLKKNRHLRGALRAGKDIKLSQGSLFEGVVIANRKIDVKKDARVLFLDLDQAPPEIVLISPADGSIVGATLEIVATYSDDLSGLRLDSVELLLDGVDRTAEAAIGEAGLTFTPPEPLADGSHTVRVAVSDRSDNRAQVTATFTVDTEAPTLMIVSPAEPVIQGAAPPIVVEYGDANGLDLDSLEIAVDGIELTDCDVTASGANCPAPELDEGSHQIAVAVSDLAGNPATASFDFAFDLPPRLTIVSPDQPLYVDPTIPDPVPEIVVAYEDGFPGIDLASLRIFLDNLEDSPDVPLLDLSPECSVGPDSTTCPTPGHSETSFRLSAEVADLGGSLTSVSFDFAIDFSSDDAAPTVTITSPADGAFVNHDMIAVEGTVSDDGELVFVFVNGDDAVEDGETWTGEAMLFGQGPNEIMVQAYDGVGKASPVVARMVIFDTLAPTLEVTSPITETFTSDASLTVSGLAGDENGVELTVAGQTATVDEDGQFEVSVPLVDGFQILTVIARDPAGNETSSALEVTSVTPPSVTITSPAPLARIVGDVVEVSGTVDEPVTSVEVAGVLAEVSGTTFTATVPITEGSNLLSAVAIDLSGAAGSAAVQVFRDSTPPLLGVTFPADGATVRQGTTTVIGGVKDVTFAPGTPLPTVTVAGIPAEVSGGAFLATGVPLAPGANQLTVVATDEAGNSTSRQVSVSFEPPSGAVILPVSGDLQTGTAGQPLPEPVVVELRDAVGQPVPGAPVIFRVVANDGAVDAGAGSRRAVAATSDAQGRAAVDWTLGQRAGFGLDRLEVSAVGFAGPATFTARTLPGPPALLHLDSGTGQTGAVGRPLPLPFVVVVTDSAHNPLPDVPVSFRVDEGGGRFAGGATELDVISGTDGRATVFFELGEEEGDDNQLVVAELVGTDDAPIYFHASALTPGEPLLTTVAGVVLDNTDAPVPGVTLSIAGTALSATSNSEGQFVLGSAPVGEILLIADGDTTTRPGSWPTLEFEMVTVAGRLNSLGRPIHMLPLDVASGVVVDPVDGATLTLPQVPGFALEIAPGSATFGDGGGSGQVSVTVVHSDKVPMLPNFGEQPLLAVTIQPSDVTFDPPARITLPNVEGLAPGAVSEIYSFRHDQGQFVSVGTATVSADGTTLASDPGFGIVEGGWHVPPRYPRMPPRDPRGNSCGGCPQCTNCVDGSCRAPSNPPPCDDGKFCTRNDKCEFGGCAGEKVGDEDLGTLQVDIPTEEVEGPLRIFTLGGQCDLTEPKFFGNFQVKRTRKCCENLNTFKTNETLTGNAGFNGLGFKCLIPGASVNAGLFKAGLRVGGSWGGSISAAGGTDACQTGCDREFGVTAMVTATVELVFETVAENVFELAAGGSYGGSVAGKIGCGNSSLNGMAGPLKVHGTAKLFNFVSITIEEEVPGTKFGPI